MGNVRSIKVLVGVVDGGVAIDWRPWPGLPHELFKEFLHALLRAAGFPWPELVEFERNRWDGEVDWRHLRISNDQCQIADVDPWRAVMQLRRWLHDNKDLRRRYSLEFLLAGDQVPEPV